MASLIIGDGQTRSSQNDADIFKAIFGDGTLITQGEMRATKPDNNTIRIGHGLAVCEGRFFTNEIYDDFIIPTGNSGQKTNYYLGYRIYREAAGDRIEKFIGQSKPNQGSLSAGDNEMFAILYKVTMDGINLGDPELLVNEIPDIVKKMLGPDGVITTVVELKDSKVPNQQILLAKLSKEGKLVIMNFSNVMHVRDVNKNITLEGLIPVGYRPKHIESITSALVAGENVSGHIRFLIGQDGKVRYNSTAKGWQEIFGSACWFTED